METLNVKNLKKLQSLNCGQAKLKSVNLEGLDKLIGLSVNKNEITSITYDSLPSILGINCEDNKLDSLDTENLVNIESIICSKNNIKSLKLSKLYNLEELICNNNSIANLSLEGLIKLDLLNCEQNLLTELVFPKLEKLVKIVCSYNNISNISLDSLINITHLEVGGNKLSELRVSGHKYLKFINCGGNDLTKLELFDLPSINELKCGNTLLKHVDLSNITLNQCYLASNEFLESIFMKNSQDAIGNFFVFFNPNLKYICVSEKLIPRFKQIVAQEGYDSCVVNSYCSFVPGGQFSTLHGNQKFDNLSDGCDSGDTQIPLMKFKIKGQADSTVIFSDKIGNYLIPLISGMYRITPLLEYPDYFEIDPGFVDLLLPDTTSSINQNFCISKKGLFNDLEISALPVNGAIAGFESKYQILFKNNGTTIQNGNVELDFQGQLVKYSWSDSIPTFQTSDKLTWDFVNLKPFEEKVLNVSFNLNRPTDEPPLNNGDVLNFNFAVKSQFDDETPDNNIFILNQNVLNSFDPNDKTCLEGDYIKVSKVGEYLHYLIRFENIGTYKATNIVVKDIIDTSKLDISTLVPLSSGHNFVTRIFKQNVEFIFEGINLSFENGLNDGFITFKIKSKNSLKVSDTITNKAEIYFDFNFPIVTNLVKTVIETSTSVKKMTQSNSVINFYPNPAGDYIHYNYEHKEIKLIIYNEHGLAVKTFESDSGGPINISNLNPGIYFLKTSTMKNTYISKMIKL